MYPIQHTGGGEWSAIIAVIANAVDNYLEFDAWCLVRGFDPLEIPSRRLMAAAWAFLTENMEPETKEKLIYDLTTEDKPKPARKRVARQPEEKTGAPAPKGKWRAAEGWTPPGWNEKQAMANAKQFMNFQSNIGGKGG